MAQDNNYKHSTPQESYSRELDSRVQDDEKPYGYSADPAPADTGDFNQRKYETKNQSRPRK